MGLGRAAVLGVSSSGVGALASFLIRFSFNATIARMIAPAAFGTFALAFVYSEFLSIILAAGFAHAIVQLKDEPEHTVPATLQLTGLGGLLFAALSALCYPFALRSDGADVAVLVLALAPSRVLTQLVGVYDAVLQRNLAFAKLAFVRTIGVAVSMVGAFGLAAAQMPVAALVAREFLSAFVTAGFLLAEVPIRWSEVVRPSERTKEVRTRVWQLGRSLFAVQTLEILYQRVDQLLLGRMLGPASLAYYYQSRYIAMLPLAALVPATHTVATRVFVEIAGQPAKVKQALELIQTVVIHVMAITALSLVIAPESIIAFAFGSKWLPCIETLPLLAIWIFLMPLARNLQVALMALTRWQAVRRGQFAQLVTLVILAPILVWTTGARGAALALGAGVLVGAAWMWFGLSHEERPEHLVYSVGTTVLLAIVSVWLGVRRYCPDNHGARISAFAAASVLYASLVYAFDGARLVRIARTIRTQFGRRAPSRP